MIRPAMMMSMMNSTRQLELLRGYRTRRERDVSISMMVGDIAIHAERTRRRMGELIELWERLVPAELASRTSLSGLRGGVLHVIVESSSANYELDRLLREGLTQELRRNFRGTLMRIKTRIGKFS